MSRKINPDYEQTLLFPPALEDWIGPEHPARFIREFVDSMDLEAMGISWGSDSLRGQPGYSASLLLKVHLYARFIGVRSLRRMEVACRDNLGMMWLAGLNAPDHNTLCNFFNQNRRTLRTVFKHSLVVALRANLVGMVLHALDGTKVQAAVANDSGWHRERLETQLEKLDQAVVHLEAQLARSYETEAAQDTALPEALQRKEGLRAHIRECLEALHAVDEKHLHPHDEDARVMKCRDKGRNTFAYNNQAVVDEHSGLIVAEEATTDPADSGQLTPPLAQVRANLGGDASTTVADAGYASARQFQEAERQGHDVMVNLSKRLLPNPDAPFAGANFRYIEETNTMTCPWGKTLEYTHTRWHAEKQEHLRCYRCYNKQCPLRSRCSKDPKGRKIEIGEGYEALQRQRDKHQDPSQRAKLAKRCHIVEPVFAWIKQQLGFRRHTVFGLSGAQAEWSLITAIYNLHRLYQSWRRGEIPLTPPRTSPQRG